MRRLVLRLRWIESCRHLKIGRIARAPPRIRLVLRRSRTLRRRRRRRQLPRHRPSGISIRITRHSGRRCSSGGTAAAAAAVAVVAFGRWSFGAGSLLTRFAVTLFFLERGNLAVSQRKLVASSAKQTGDVARQHVALALQRCNLTDAFRADSEENGTAMRTRNSRAALASLRVPLLRATRAPAHARARSSCKLTGQERRLPLFRCCSHLATNRHIVERKQLIRHLTFTASGRDALLRTDGRPATTSTTDRRTASRRRR